MSRRSQRGLSSFPQHSLLTLSKVKRTGNQPNYLISTTRRGQNINLLSPTQSVKCWRLRLTTSRHDITSKCQLNLDFPKKPSKGSLRVQVNRFRKCCQRRGTGLVLKRLAISTTPKDSAEGTHATVVRYTMSGCV